MEAFVLKWETLRSTGYVGEPRSHIPRGSFILCFFLLLFVRPMQECV